MPKQARLNFTRTNPAPAMKRRRLSTGDVDNREQSEPSNKSLKSQSSSSSSRATKNNASSTNVSRQNNRTAHKKTNVTASASATRSDDRIKNRSESSEAHSSPLAAELNQATSKHSQKMSSQPTTSTTATNKHIKLTYSRTSLFASPPHTVLCHATNAQGSWGAGIAAAFKTHYPKAFTLYSAHCKKWPSSTLLSTTLLIPPQTSSHNRSEREAKHWIGCLFTSAKYGKGKGSKESILEATGEAMGDLVRQVGAEEGKIEGVRMCKINSGLFGVPWEDSVAVIEGVEAGEGVGGVVREIVVCSLD